MNKDFPNGFLAVFLRVSDSPPVDRNLAFLLRQICSLQIENTVSCLIYCCCIAQMRSVPTKEKTETASPSLSSLLLRR